MKSGKRFALVLVTVPDLRTARKLAQATLRNIRENLFLAFVAAVVLGAGDARAGQVAGTLREAGHRVSLLGVGGAVPIQVGQAQEAVGAALGHVEVAIGAEGQSGGRLGGGDERAQQRPVVGAVQSRREPRPRKSSFSSSTVSPSDSSTP
mgnify:CR=1 FL=1